MGVVVTLIMGGCVAGAVVGGPCFFDPPPGDFGVLPVVNDTAATVAVADCNGEATCGATGELKTVGPGATTTLTVESCDAGTLGIFRPGNSAPFGCLAETTRRADGTLPPVRIADAKPCR
jgi:hypothetical protein